jgi:hypothetical protein
MPVWIRSTAIGWALLAMSQCSGQGPKWAPYGRQRGDADGADTFPDAWLPRPESKWLLQTMFGALARM